MRQGFGTPLTLSENMAPEKKTTKQASLIPFAPLIPSFQAVERNRAHPSHRGTSQSGGESKETEGEIQVPAHTKQLRGEAGNESL